jgi:hypothetical protein
MSEVAELFIGMARKYNHFEDQGFEDQNHSCKSCIRKHYSFPETCNDGWPMGGSNWEDRGSRCLNWLNKGEEG